MISVMNAASKKQYTKNFTADKIHGAYEQLLKGNGY
jgi:hypothetical protein